MYELVLLCIGSPMFYAVYKDKNLVFEGKKEGKILDSLHCMQCELQKQNIRLEAVYYARGPGNLSALKLAHTFLHTLAVAEGVRLRACDSFDLLGDVAIFAYGKRYFIKCNDEIKCVFLNLDCSFDSVVESSLDSSLDSNLDFSAKSSQPKNADTSQPKAIFDSKFEFRFSHFLDTSRFASPCTPLYILPPV